MRVELFPFQKKALASIRMNAAEAMGSYRRTHTSQVVSFTAPTGSGKTIIMSALIEDILFGNDKYVAQSDAVFVWLSDSPQLNEQSKQKIEGKADKIRSGQCVTVSEESFDLEMFEDGNIYFLNTQKLSVSSKLTKNGDDRTYTIWETLANTVREKSDRLYFIIDEAHRGMQGREAGRATTIMQKFIKGSEADRLPSMPVVIGMSATIQRFNALVEGTSSTIHKSVVTPDEVRASGLLKDRIVITYPDEGAVNNDIAILQAAADDWKEKWDHWTQYCYEQHYAYVNPILIIQVLNGTGGKLTDTDLDDCLAKIEERTGFKFDKGQVVHTFGGTTASIKMNGIEVIYKEPSEISDDRKIRVVFFKENLSTGWDCPRAETMMSFRRAKDSTYIAQLLGRMVRTPMQKHIQVDDILNDVHLYLPYFDENTVKDVIEALQNNEGGEIPADIYGESSSGKRFENLTVKTKRKKGERQIPGQIPLDFSDGQTPVPSIDGGTAAGEAEGNDFASATSQNSAEQEFQEGLNEQSEPQKEGIKTPADQLAPTSSGTSADIITLHDGDKQRNRPLGSKPSEDVISTNRNEDAKNPAGQPEPSEGENEDPFDREEIVKFINDYGLLNYDVRNVRITKEYLKSLFKIAHLLTMSNLYKEAISDVQDEIVEMIHSHVEEQKNNGRYDYLVQQVKQFKLATKIFDAFGESVNTYSVHDIFTTTDADIDRQFQIADSKLCSEGIGIEYGKKYGNDFDQVTFKVDFIIFVADEDCAGKLEAYAEERFHGLLDDYRRYIAQTESEEIRRDYDSIVSDGDVVSKHNFRLPETIQIRRESGGKEYRNHLFVSDETGVAKLKLNTWESGVIAEEEKQDDFVCWIRNPPRAAWALCIPYEMEGEQKSMYPDFIVVRKDRISKYVIDILEPHNPDFKDNLGKAKGLAEYASQNPGVGRIQLIRMSRDAAGKNQFRRLDMAKATVRDKVSKAINTDELDHIFDKYGFFM